MKAWVSLLLKAVQAVIAVLMTPRQVSSAKRNSSESDRKV